MDTGVEILGEISDIEVIAAGASIRQVQRPRRVYGQGRWRKLKGQALVRLPDNTVCLAEVHWYEAQGVRRK